MKGWAERWSSFPAAHRKRFYQGLGGYILICAVAASWVSMHAESTVKDWQSQIPVATAEIKTLASVPKTAVQPIADNKIYISVIVSGLGLSKTVTEKAINELPADVTLAFSPYADTLQEWISKAAQLHHETLMQMPMESTTASQGDPGPKAFSSRLSDDENNENLNWLLARSKGTAGMINLMGSRFLTDQKRLSPVFEALQKSELIFIETPGIEKSAGATVAGQTQLPYFAADLQIDAVATDTDIRKQLEVLEKIARARGYAVAIAEPYPITLNLLKTWITELETRGMTLAPLTSVWKNKPHDPSAAPSQEQLRQP